MSRDDNRQIELFQDRAINVVKPLVPPDAEERVQNTYRQMNKIVRECIRSETGLKLAAGNSGGASIPVRVVEGFPAEFAQLINQYNNPAIWILLSAQTKLGGVVDGLQHLLHYWPKLEQWQDFPAVARGSEPTLQKACEVVSALQMLALTEKVRKEIACIQEDLLGAYFFSRAPTGIELYWLPIALVAGMIDVRIEDLTVVVMTHELAHGYTHLGRDIDGKIWDTRAFGSSAKEVTEGLAQLYTAIISDRLSARVPDARKAFNALLKLQSGPYLIHRDWNKYSATRLGETVRFALLAARSHGTITYDEWLKTLSETAPRLGKGKELGVEQAELAL